MVRFQQLVELRECRVMLDEAGKAFRSGRLPDFKNGLASWRDRLPNFWSVAIVAVVVVVSGRSLPPRRRLGAFYSS